MGIELFGFCHQFYSTAYVADTVFRKVLESNLPAV
jgi:hypothetical protein